MMQQPRLSPLPPELLIALWRQHQDTYQDAIKRLESLTGDRYREYGDDPERCIAWLRTLAATHPNPAVVYLASAMARFEGL
jgi:hypothetical protein